MAVLTRNLIRNMIKEEMTTRHLHEAEPAHGGASAEAAVKDLGQIVDEIIDHVLHLAGAEGGKEAPEGSAVQEILSGDIFSGGKDPLLDTMISLLKAFTLIGNLGSGVEAVKSLVTSALEGLADADDDGVPDLLDSEEGEPEAPGAEDIVEPEGGTAAMEKPAEEPEEGLSLNERFMRSFL